jgi:hypothetical protein
MARLAKTLFDLGEEGVDSLLELLKKSGDTQVATTGGSYQKAGDILRREGVTDNVLDYGAGRGHGTQYLPGNAQSYEPNPKPGYTPDFTDSPDQMYDGIANLNVLNVVPEPVRSQIAGDIMGKLNKDGVAAIGARSYSDVMNAKNPNLLDDGGIITQKGTYQYGFGGENEGLVDYLQRQADQIPDKKFEITKEPLAATGALVKRLESIMGPAVVGAAAGGAALAPEDAEAGVSFGLAKNVDLDRLVSAWQKAVSRNPEIDPSTHLQNIIHNKMFTNYNEFGEFARKADGGKNGDTYFDGLKPMLIDISKHPKVAKDSRLRKGLVQYADTRFAQRKKQGHRPDGQRGSADPYSLLPVAGIGGAAAALAAPHIADSGMASPVRSETLGDITMGLRDLERNLEGSPMSLLFPEGLTNYLETVNRETEDPNMLTRAMALLDVMP